MSNAIRYIKNSDIDKEKWDSCIEAVEAAHIYATSAYMDHLSPGWNALVAGDYEAVMPVFSKIKFGIKYLYEPAFLPQGGIFQSNESEKIAAVQFLNQLLKNFKYGDITFNTKHEEVNLESCKSSSRNNFVVMLDAGYEAAFDNYLPTFHKSLRRIKKFNLQYGLSNDFVETIKEYQKLYASRNHFRDEDFQRFIGFCDNCPAGIKVITRNALDENGEQIASVLLLSYKRHLYNIISNISTKGKLLEANYFLYDSIIKEFAGHYDELDLEGSDVKGIADFYKKMGPVNQPYSHIHINQLPVLMRFLKK